LVEEVAFQRTRRPYQCYHTAWPPKPFSVDNNPMRLWRDFGFSFLPLLSRGAGFSFLPTSISGIPIGRFPASIRIRGRSFGSFLFPPFDSKQIEFLASPIQNDEEKDQDDNFVLRLNIFFVSH